ncbi:amidohydrolase [Sinomicrobium soli]|uniref:amidohydrolase n=1 Tax=Sinomicrobium sp. N-1-3-6 TaxID=2219864 RepID=UPI001375077E|nr:amidohydrolase [Sinomicrobium sp. N-1-3-6]
MIKRNIAGMVILTGMMCSISSCTDSLPADRIVYGNIWTADTLNPRVEAMAVKADTILAVGTEDEIERYRGSETVITDLAPGNMVVPGFIDSHTHYVDGGLKLSSVQLRDVKSPEEFIRRIAAYATKVKPGEWIIGGSWDHQNWGGELPEARWIDSVTPENPVWLNRLDGHMCLTNSLGMKLAGIDKNTPEMEGGRVFRKEGAPTGLFKDNAKTLIVDRIPMPSDAQLDKALETAMDQFAAQGITSVVSVTGTGFGAYFDVYQRARRKNALKTRIYAVKELEEWKSLAEMITKEGKGDKWLKYGGVKGFVDGSLGSHTAAFTEPYHDAPRDSGFFVTDRKLLYSRIKSADSAGLQILVHAIGDRSVHTLLNMAERLNEESGKKDRRFRMEHAQHILPEDFSRFAALGVIASVQPYHAIDDGRWAEKVIGPERIRRTYAFRSLLDAGATIALGSDWFVAPSSPLLGIYAATTRRTIDDAYPDGWVPEQKITPEEALYGYTLNAAYATFEDHIKGSLAKGKLADFVVLEKNILETAPEDIKDIKVLETVVGGRTTYQP